MTMDVHAGADHDGQVQHQGGFAQDDLAVLVGQFLVPGVSQVDGRGSNTGAALVLSSVRIGHTLVLALVKVVGVGAAGAVVRRKLRELNGGDGSDVVEGRLGKGQEFRHGHLVHQLFPAGIVKGRALQVGDGQLGGGVAEDQVGHILAGGQRDEVVLQELGHLCIGGQASVSLGPGAVPVSAGQVGHYTGLEGVVIHGVVALSQLVGDGHAGVSGGEGLVVHIASPGPLVSLGLISVSGHAVSNGLALGSQDVVQRVVSALADGEVVIAGIDDVGLCTKGVVRSQVGQIHVHDDGLLLAGLQGDGLFEVHQLDGGLLHTVLLVILGVGHGSIQLDDGLARHVAGILDGHGDGRGLLVLSDLDAVQGLLEGGVAQAVAEGIHDFISIVPGAVHSGNGAVRIGVGTGRSLVSAIAQHDIGIAGLVVAVALVDAFRLDQVAVDVHLRGEVSSIGPRNVAVVHHGRRKGAVLGHDVAQVSGGGHGAVQHVRHAVEAVSAGEADPHDRVDGGILGQVADFHGAGRVHQHDDLVEVGLRLFDHGHFFLGQGQDVAGDGFHALGQAFLAGVETIAGLAAGTAHDHDGRIAVLGVILLEIRIERQQLVHGELTGIVEGGDIRILRDDAAAETGLGPFLVGEELLIRRQGAGVELEAALLESVEDLHGRLAIGDGASVGAVHRRVGTHAQHGDLRVLGKGQRAVFILQQRVGLLGLADGEFLQTLVGLLGRLEFRLEVPGVFARLVLSGDDLLAAGTEECVNSRTVRFHDGTGHQAHCQQQREDDRQAPPEIGSLEHGDPPFVFFNPA